MKLTFRQLLSRPDREGRCRVVLDVTWDAQRLKLPTGVSCLPAHFTAGALRPVSTKDPASARLNALLSAALTRVEQAALQAVAAGRLLTPADLAPPEKAAPAPTLPVTATEFYALWQAHNPTKPENSRRQYQQVVAHLDAYHPDWAVSTLTRSEFQAYLSYLHRLGLADATVTKHVKFLRECLRLADKGVPGWLKVRTRYGRSPALQAPEFRQLLALDLSQLPALAQERDLFVLQTLLLLRDSDLRRLQPHHVATVDLPGCGPVPVLSIHQQKTGDELRLPLPPQAAAIWQRLGGRLFVPVQQYRNRHMKQLMEMAGLSRTFVQVTYVANKPVEQVLPLWQVVTTHTARHTGADLIMLGSGGNSDLKEKALGHAAVYGHDNLERYGPLLLSAWVQVLGAKPDFAPKISDSPSW